MSQPDNSLECQECNITFGDKDATLQHMSTFHQRSAKRRKLGKSLTDGVIVKDGKYECQFCHKTFSERHRYNGHIGAHIRYEGLSVDTLPQDMTAATSSNSSPLSIMPVHSSEMNTSPDTVGKAYTTESINNQKHSSSPQCIAALEPNGDKHNPEAGVHDITEDVSSNYKKGIEHNPKAGAPEINEGVTGYQRIKHEPKEIVPEITEAVDYTSRNGYDSKENTLEIDEAVVISNSPDYDYKKGTPEVAGVSSGKFVDIQSKGLKITCEESSENIKARTITDLTSSACTNDVSSCETDINNVSQTCSTITIPEPSTSQFVRDQMNGGDISVEKSVVIKENNVEVGKPNICPEGAHSFLVDMAARKTISDDGLPPSRKIANENISNHMVGHNFDNNPDADDAMCIEIPEAVGHFSSKDKFFNGQINGCDIVGHKYEIMDNSEAMSIEVNSCVDALSPSLIVVDNSCYENTNTIDPSACTVVSAIEYCNGSQKVPEEHHLLSLSSNGLSCGIETFSSGILTSKIEKHVDLDISSHDKREAGGCQALTNKDIDVAGTMQNELNTSYIFTNIANEPTSGVEMNADCMFSGDLNKSLLEGIDRVGNELQNYFHSGNLCNEDASNIITSNGDGRQALQVNMADQSSWVESSNSLPILDLIPDQVSLHCCYMVT